MTKHPKGSVHQGQTFKTIKGTFPPKVAGPKRPTKGASRSRILKKTGGGSSYG